MSINIEIKYFMLGHRVSCLLLVWEHYRSWSKRASPDVIFSF